MVHFVLSGGGLSERSSDLFSDVDACSTSCCNAPAVFDLSIRPSSGRRRFRLSRAAPASARVSTREVPLASLTSSVWTSIRESNVWRGFNPFGGGDKEVTTEGDLEAYAQSEGLPSTYVSQFLSALSASSAVATAIARQCGPHHVQQLQQQAAGSNGRPVDLDAFRQFVRSREDALRRAFSMFDKDKHGSISSADLEAALRHVTLCCPKSRCIYRRSQQCQATRQIILGATQGQERPIAYPAFRELFLQLPASEVMVKFWLAAGCVPDLDTRFGQYGTSPPVKASAWGHLFAGAMAGAASRTATAPLETLRLSAMAGTLSTNNLVLAAQDIVSSEGWKGLYKGNLVNVVRAAPQKALDFFAFDMFKRLLSKSSLSSGTSPSLGETLLAAGLAGASSCIALYPLEVVRSRITIAKGCIKYNVFDALVGIARNEGPRALYKGLLPSVAAIIPEAAITYGLHDLLKQTYRNWHNGKEPGVMTSLSLGVASAFTGQLVAFPLEAISRRLQMAQGGAGGLEGMRQVVTQLLKEGGPPALYRGVGAATLRLVPMAVTSFGTYELVRSLLVHLEEQQESEQAEKEYDALRQQLASSCRPLELTPLLAAALVAVPCAQAAGIVRGGPDGGSTERTALRVPDAEGTVGGQGAVQRGTELR